jgi:hypothetical protein
VRIPATSLLCVAFSVAKSLVVDDHSTKRYVTWCSLSGFGNKRPENDSAIIYGNDMLFWKYFVSLRW